MYSPACFFKRGVWILQKVNWPDPGVTDPGHLKRCVKNGRTWGIFLL